MDFYNLSFDEFGTHRPWPFDLVANTDALNLMVARIAVDAIRDAGQAGREILIITPVGPLDYSYWARLCNQEQVSCEPLITMNMDEYIDDNDDFIPDSHPLSFHEYLNQTFVANLDPSLRPDPANLHFPNPHEPQETTALIESFGGADLCFGGCGLTGHFAFNDPPEPGEPCDDDQVRQSKTRRLEICRESQAQMCMGGTNGNWDIIPKRAVTLGMYELLLSKKIYLTFMRNWHAGVLRRVLFGPVTARCPGSFVQEHPNVEVILTELAAAVPVMNVAQATGERG